MKRCFACDRKLGRNPVLVDTRDDQCAFVGSECFKLIKRAGDAGWQPPKGGPRLYLLPSGLSQQQLGALFGGARLVEVMAPGWRKTE